MCIHKASSDLFLFIFAEAKTNRQKTPNMFLFLDTSPFFGYATFCTSVILIKISDNFDITRNIKFHPHSILSALWVK